MFRENDSPQSRKTQRINIAEKCTFSSEILIEMNSTETSILHANFLSDQQSNYYNQNELFHQTCASNKSEKCYQNYFDQNSAFNCEIITNSNFFDSITIRLKCLII